jgi:hypothetical protein
MTHEYAQTGIAICSEDNAVMQIRASEGLREARVAGLARMSGACGRLRAALLHGLDERRPGLLMGQSGPPAREADQMDGPVGGFAGVSGKIADGVRIRPRAQR